MTKNTTTRKIRCGEIGKVEIDNIKARTRFINHSNLREWIMIFIGITIVAIGGVFFIGDTENAKLIAFMFVGVFILAGKKSKIGEILKQVV